MISFDQETNPTPPISKPPGAEVVRDRIGHRVRLHHVADAEGRHRGAEGEDPAQPRRAQAAAQVIHRPAGDDPRVVDLPVLLREHRAHALRAHAEQRGDPHPEDGARPAGDEARRHAGDVAGADGGRQRRREGLQVGGLAVVLGVVPASADERPGVAEEPELDEAQADRQVDARPHEYEHHEVAPHPAVHLADQFGEAHRVRSFRRDSMTARREATPLYYAPDATASGNDGTATRGSPPPVNRARRLRRAPRCCPAGRRPPARRCRRGRRGSPGTARRRAPTPGARSGAACAGDAPRRASACSASSR